MTNNCEIHQQTAAPVLTMRVRIPVQDLPDFLGKAYAEIFQYLAMLGEAPAGFPFVAYYNMDMHDLDVEAGFPVSKPLPGKEAIQAGALPEANVAETVFTGPYVEMGPAYEELSQWTKEQGCEASGVVYEFYLNDPAQVLPDQLQTKIVYILKK
jgi:effector-binding domain-containing protein